MMMYGRFEHTIDAKGRVFVPVKLRAKLGETFIAARILDRCVSLYSNEDWDRLLEKLADSELENSREMMRQVTENADDVTLDSSGRILLKKDLIKQAQLEKSVLIIGAGRRAEIWDPAVYAEDMAGVQNPETDAQLRRLGF